MILPLFLHLLPQAFSFSEKVEKWISQLSLDEKLSLLGGQEGFYIGNIKEIPRRQGLDDPVPGLSLNDATQGFRLEWPKLGECPGSSTAYPSALSMASSFDPELVEYWAESIADEFLEKGSNVLLGPGVNVARIPWNGRNFEYISGEDPFLGASLVAPYVQTVQSKNIIATVKHYLHNNQETDRMQVSANVGQRTTQEIYLPPFLSAVKEGGCRSVMCSYNKVNGTYACENSVLLQDELRGRLGFKGFVMSDWFATHSSEKAAKSGLDQEMPFGDFYANWRLKQKLEEGTLEEADLNIMAGNILQAMEDVGVASAQTERICFNSTNEKRREVARETASRGIILLKNERVLPFSPEKEQNVALFGASCLEAPIISGGGSGYVTPSRIVSIFQGVEEVLGSENVKYSRDYSQDLVDWADAVLVCGSGSSSEGQDRKNLLLNEDALISRLGGEHPRIIVVASPPRSLPFQKLDRQSGRPAGELHGGPRGRQRCCGRHLREERANWEAPSDHASGGERLGVHCGAVPRGGPTAGLLGRTHGRV